MRTQVEILLTGSNRVKRENELFHPESQGIRHKPSSLGPLEFRARRKPMLLLRFDGSFLLRFADWQFAASLFQLPPRFTRFEPLRFVHLQWF